jgi:hypothetical protein
MMHFSQLHHDVIIQITSHINYGTFQSLLATNKKIYEATDNLTAYRNNIRLGQIINRHDCELLLLLELEEGNHSMIIRLFDLVKIGVYYINPKIIPHLLDGLPEKLILEYRKNNQYMLSDVGILSDNLLTLLFIIETRYGNKLISNSLIDDFKNRKISFLCRGDFIGEYVGWTVPKTLAQLVNVKGRLLLINKEEIQLGTEDFFGKEAIVTINNYMHQNPAECICLF